jgi:putative phosphoesterase
VQRIGLISDTHGLLRDEAIDELRGCDRILHAGDIGVEDVLRRLAALAPVIAVRGNNDAGPWADALPESADVTVEDVTIRMIHDLADLELCAGSTPQVVVTGHSHRPKVASRDGVLYVNPGSAGPRRFKLPIAVGELLIDGRRVDARIVELAVAPAKPRRR